MKIPFLFRIFAGIAGTAQESKGSDEEHLATAMHLFDELSG